MLRDGAFDLPAALDAPTSEWESRGATVLHVIRGTEVVGALALEDQIRPESRAAVEQLHALGVRVGMITGDSQAVANAVATELGIDEVIASSNFGQDQSCPKTRTRPSETCRSGARSSPWSVTV